MCDILSLRDSESGTHCEDIGQVRSRVSLRYG